MAFSYLTRPPDVIITDGPLKGNRGWNLGRFGPVGILATADQKGRNVYRFRKNFLVVVRINHRIESGMVIPLHGFRRGYEFRRDQFTLLDKRGNIHRRELKGR